MTNGLQRNSNDKTEWMVAYVTHNLSEAHIVAGRLKHEGIPAIVNHMAGRSAIGITIGAMGEVRVLVHPQDYDMAQDILFPEGPDELPDSTHDENTIYLDDWDANDDS